MAQKESEKIYPHCCKGNTALWKVPCSIQLMSICFSLLQGTLQWRKSIDFPMARHVSIKRLYISEWMLHGYLKAIKAPDLWASISCMNSVYRFSFTMPSLAAKNAKTCCEESLIVAQILPVAGSLLRSISSTVQKQVCLFIHLPGLCCTLIQRVLWWQRSGDLKVNSDWIASALAWFEAHCLMHRLANPRAHSTNANVATHQLPMYHNLCGLCYGLSHPYR